MTCTVAITDRALAELDGFCQWWSENRSTEQALRWYNGFIKAIRGLATNLNAALSHRKTTPSHTKFGSLFTDSAVARRTEPCSRFAP